MSEPEAVYLTAEEIADLLGEPNVVSHQKIHSGDRRDTSEAILEHALHIEATGGMRTHDQSRRRTPGGTFFALMRDAVSRGERYRLFSVPGSRPQGPHRHPSPHVRGTMCLWHVTNLRTHQRRPR